MKKYIFLLSSLFIVSLVITSCKSKDEDELWGNWISASDFGGNIRSEASIFMIGDSVYVCCGYNSLSSQKYLTDMWVFDINQNIWSQRSDFPGTPRSNAAGFSADNKGYVGIGYNDGLYYKDFYSFNPSTNKWAPIAEFKGSARTSAVAFNTANYGYVGTGFNDIDNYLSDFWKYNPSDDSWTQISSIGGSKRTLATAFMIGNNAYVCGGKNSRGYPNDFWMFDTTTEKWEEKRKIANVSTESYDDDYRTIVRASGVAIIIDGKAYLTCGEAGNSALTNATWRYEPQSDLWYEVTSFEGFSRTGAVAFSVKNRGFVGTGRNASKTPLDDMWEFKPYEERVAND